MGKRAQFAIRGVWVCSFMVPSSKSFSLVGGTVHVASKRGSQETVGMKSHNLSSDCDLALVLVCFVPPEATARLLPPPL